MIVYLRSLPAVRNELPKTEIAFPVKYLIRSAPEPVTMPVSDGVDSSDLVQRGSRLVNLAGCGDCHTPTEKGQSMPGMEFAGGAILAGP